ncbi:hypothetical protein M5K25_024778 [Dendrobium thyrsiflorum]|uniref:Uncharacterized protein n=1 Tax=Dendrobium thyrsiflorum TaxID=117978 RepID=A0ABD0U358_DENTH
MFWWRILHNAIPTNQFLSHRRLQEDCYCPRCPGEVEDVQHLTIGCKKLREAAQLLNSWGFGIPFFSSMEDCGKWMAYQNPWLLKLYCNIVFFSWKSRNTRVHGGSDGSALVIAANAVSYSVAPAFFYFHNKSGIWDVNQLMLLNRWHPPPPDWIKVNVDASLLPSYKAGIAGVFRDHKGRFLLAFGHRCVHWDISWLELLAIKSIMDSLSDWMFKFKGIIIEGDNINIIKYVQSLVLGGEEVAGDSGWKKSRQNQKAVSNIAEEVQLEALFGNTTELRPALLSFRFYSCLPGIGSKVFGHSSKLSNIKVILNGGQTTTFVRADGYFSFCNIPAGTHLIEVAAMGYLFSPVRVDISARNPGKIQAALTENRRVLQELVLEPLREEQYYEMREPFSIMSIVKSPMGLMLGFMFLVVFLMPKLMENMGRYLLFWGIQKEKGGEGTVEHTCQWRQMARAMAHGVARRTYDASCMARHMYAVELCVVVRHSPLISMPWRDPNARFMGGIRGGRENWGGGDPKFWKLKMSMFEGEDAHGWIYRVERYCTMNELTEDPEEMRRAQEEMRNQGVPSLSNLLSGRTSNS